MQQCADPRACNPDLPNVGLSCSYNPRLGIIHLGLIQFCEFLLVLNLSLLVCNIKYTKFPSFAPVYLFILLLLFYFIFDTKEMKNTSLIVLFQGKLRDGLWTLI